jgi:hypothetical protein
VRGSGRWWLHSGWWCMVLSAAWARHDQIEIGRGRRCTLAARTATFRRRVGLLVVASVVGGEGLLRHGAETLTTEGMGRIAGLHHR